MSSKGRLVRYSVEIILVRFDGSSKWTKGFNFIKTYFGFLSYFIMVTEHFDIFTIEVAILPIKRFSNDLPL